MAGIVGNKYFNDPALGQAFSNIAQMFAPPSGSDLAGYAAAGAKKAEAARLADLFNYAQSADGFDQSTFDRMGQAVGQWNPSNGYYGVNVGAATSRANNADDNARALRVAGMDNERALATNRLDNQRQAITSLYGALDPGQVAPALPDDIASIIGLPAIGERQGIDKPLTDDQVKGAIIGSLPQADQREIAMSGVNVEQIVGANGQPVIASRQAAVGQQPYIKPNTDNATEISRLIEERDRLPADSPNRAAFDARIQALGRGQQQSAYDRTMDEADAKLNDEISASAMKSLADRGTYATVLAAVNNPSVDQGTAASAKLALRKSLNAFGVDAGDTGPAEMLNALGAQLALRLRDPSSGAGMPGAMSDADRNFLQSMSISLGNSPQANRLLAQYFMAIQQKNIDLNDLRAAYVEKNGRIDEGFRNQMAEYLAANDPTRKLQEALSAGQPGAETPAPQVGAPRPPIPAGAVEDGWRFKGGDPRDQNNWERVE
ncbi:hypothetical protein [Agrobacterium pusense]|uniref:hypothetical protein n=1 Tax=Agrobacterium pusense TaxID=648995 RepID=UPI00384C0738